MKRLITFPQNSGHVWASGIRAVKREKWSFEQTPFSCKQNKNAIHDKALLLVNIFTKSQKLPKTFTDTYNADSKIIDKENFREFVTINATQTKPQR